MEKQYTWSRPNPFTARRLDYICDTYTLSKLSTSTIETFAHSDHKMVKITIKSNNFKRGPGYWKFNASLLTDDEFLKKMNDLIETHFDEYSNESAITAWETMKFKIKSACIAFSKKTL